jgi:hypothetical protein
MSENKTRVISFINDTADQQTKLNTLIEKRGIDRETAKVELSAWGLLHLKLQAMIYGEIVLADSHIYNTTIFSSTN